MELETTVIGYGHPLQSSMVICKAKKNAHLWQMVEMFTNSASRAGATSKSAMAGPVGWGPAGYKARSASTVAAVWAQTPCDSRAVEVFLSKPSRRGQARPQGWWLRMATPPPFNWPLQRLTICTMLCTIEAEGTAAFSDLVRRLVHHLCLW